MFELSVHNVAYVVMMIGFACMVGGWLRLRRSIDQRGLPLGQARTMRTMIDVGASWVVLSAAWTTIVQFHVESVEPLATVAFMALSLVLGARLAILCHRLRAAQAAGR